MTQERICSKCEKTGIKIFSRCVHILHEECFHYLICYKNDKKCPNCIKLLCNNIEVEKLAIRLKESDFDFTEVEELISCLTNFETKNPDLIDYQNTKITSYDENILAKLQKFGWDINNQSFGGEKLFYRACCIDDLAKNNLLIDHGLDLSKYGQNGLKYSALNSSFDTFERLLKLGINLNQNVIFDLISTKTFKALNRILKYGILDVNVVEGINGKRPIHAAAITGSIRKVKILIENGADFNAVDADGNSISNYASNCKDGRPLMKYLAESGFDLEVQNKKKITPMIFAVDLDNQNVFEYLKVAINNRDHEGNTPLHTYSCRGEIEIAKKLIANGANVNAKNIEGKTAFHLAVNEKMVILLLENGAKMHELDQFRKSPFYYFHHRLSANLKRRFIDAGADLSIKDSDGESIFELMLGIKVKSYILEK